MADWPEDIKQAMQVKSFIVEGGNEFDGREISPLDEEKIHEIAGWIRDNGMESAAVVAVFSPVSDAHEKRTMQILREELGEAFPVTISSEIGSVGLLERENAAF